MGSSYVAGKVSTSYPGLFTHFLREKPWERGWEGVGLEGDRTNKQGNKAFKVTILSYFRQVFVHP